MTTAIKKPAIRLVTVADKYLDIIPKPKSASVKSVAVKGVTLLLSMIPLVIPNPIHIVLIKVKKKVLRCV